MSALAGLIAGLTAFRTHRADPAPSVEDRVARLERRLSYAEELIDEGHVRLCVLEHPAFTTPDNQTATIRRPLHAAAIGAALLLALAAVPALAKDANLPTPPVPGEQPDWVQPVPTQDSALQRKQEINGEFADEMQALQWAKQQQQYLVETQQAEAVAEQLAIQRQTLDVLREIAADIEALQMRQSRAAP
jgi:hypothetical protein